MSQEPHQVAQKFISTTLPLKPESFTRLPPGAATVISGAATPITVFVWDAVGACADDGVLGPALHDDKNKKAGNRAARKNLRAVSRISGLQFTLLSTFSSAWMKAGAPPSMTTFTFVPSLNLPFRISSERGSSISFCIALLMGLAP